MSTCTPYIKAASKTFGVPCTNEPGVLSAVMRCRKLSVRDAIKEMPTEYDGVGGVVVESRLIPDGAKRIDPTESYHMRALFAAGSPPETGQDAASRDIKTMTDVEYGVLAKEHNGELKLTWAAAGLFLGKTVQVEHIRLTLG